MGAQVKLSGLPACIVAVQVKRKSPSAVATAGQQQPPAVNGEQFLMHWLEEQDELEKQAVLQRLFIRASTKALNYEPVSIEYHQRKHFCRYQHS